MYTLLIRIHRKLDAIGVQNRLLRWSPSFQRQEPRVEGRGKPFVTGVVNGEQAQQQGNSCR